MSWRAATDRDVPEIERFLQAHLDTSMFLLSNLRRFGPKGGDHDYAMRYWITGKPVSGVFALASNGSIMVQWPEPRDWSDPLQFVDRSVTRLVGHGAQIAQVRQSAGLEDAPTALNAQETLYAVDLSDVVTVEGSGDLRPMAASDRGFVRDWMFDYDVNTLGMTAQAAEARMEDAFDDALAAGSRRVLVEADTPLCLTGFNAVVDDTVQVGPVYTPPDKRGKGHARRAVSLHLQEAKAAGAKRSILFAEDPRAIAAYTAVGYRAIGRFALIFFAEPQVLA